VNNYGGRSDVDLDIAEELRLAGVPVTMLPEVCRELKPDMKTCVTGVLGPWTFSREYYYWVVYGPKISLHDVFDKLLFENEVFISCPKKEGSQYTIDSQKGLCLVAELMKNDL
jgi:hypothetical protein